MRVSHHSPPFCHCLRYPSLVSLTIIHTSSQISKTKERHTEKEKKLPSFLFPERIKKSKKKEGNSSRRKKLQSFLIYVGDAAMPYAGGKYTSAAVAVLVILIWVCFCDCQARAIRVLPTNDDHEKMNRSSSDYNNYNYKRMSKEGESLFHKYFKGRLPRNSNFNATSSASGDQHHGFQDNKRRVPSCPDPLHN